MHHIFAHLFVSLNFVIPETGWEVLQCNERGGRSLQNILVLSFHYLIYSEEEEYHLKIKGYGANIKCPGWAAMK